MTKLLWHSNAPHAPTGYGQQTAQFAPFVAEHFDLTISSYYGIEGAPIQWQGIQVLPGLGGEVGNRSLLAHSRFMFNGDLRSGLVVTLMDVWVLDAQMCEQLNMASWVPVDHDPAPPAIEKFFEVSNSVPIAMSRFGQDRLQRFDPLYCPHGIDTDAYAPRDQAKIREKYGFPKDAFLVGMVAANKGRPSRKGFSEALQAFRKFIETRDDAYLYLHTDIDELSFGENIMAIVRALGIPEERIKASDRYAMNFVPYPPSSMADIYGSLDVLLNPAHGEGFGITPLEAQSCGVPVIVTDNTAQSEVGAVGWRVKDRPFWTNQLSWQGTPDVDGIVDALVECYEMPQANRRHLAREARAHALKYDRRVVFDEFMLPALLEFERRVERRRPITIAPRKAVAA